MYTHELKAYWDHESKKDIEIHLIDSTFENKVLKTKPNIICSAKPIDTLSKVKLYTTDSNLFVTTLRDNLIWILLVNTVVLFATYYIAEDTILPGPKDTGTLPATLSDLIKKTLGFFAVILQIVFFASQLILHRTRNNRLHTELNTLK
ncbi:MAG TPA: hypothetical protein VHE34_09965 [Puia sp.]|uniref:hypothetical protein n=1 Tax=Puia sp. TaxID=2045100 RepID=UPI002CB605A7|nr:hypothetical protein [Puia sp.]HVU95541.1 hypothetical protein [Puia sp.]